VTDGSAFPWAVLAAIVGTGAAIGIVGASLAGDPGKNPLPAAVGLGVPVGLGIAATSAWELGWWTYRRRRRTVVYQAALARSRALGRPLVVLGAPDSGPTSGYGCGDVTVDLAPSACPIVRHLDITRDRLPFDDGSVVVFCSCVLEYVSDAQAAIAEIQRVSGGQAFFVGVQPWTFSGQMFPGAKRTLPAAYR
jgi:hypothetical protein